MWPYWLMYLIPAIAALGSVQRRPSQATSRYSVALGPMWLLTMLVSTLLIGYRLEVGGDWGAYLGYVYRVRYASLAEVLSMGDPGYQLINWISDRLEWGIWGVNLFCGAVFSLGLAFFCRSLPRPWLALAVAVPYLVTVVAMGYSRQGVALGFAMMGLVALGRRQNLWFVVWVLLGATCHKSAVLLLPVAALSATRNRYWTALWVGVVSLGAYYLLLEDAVEQLYTGYIEAQYQSQGAFIRLAMNAIPAAILLLWHKRFAFSRQEAALWRWFALISLALMAVLMATPATTAVDRVALYMLPLQLVVFSHIPSVFGRTPNAQSLLVAAIVGYYALVLFVWLNFAAHAYAWVPYRNYLFQ